MPALRQRAFARERQAGGRIAHGQAGERSASEVHHGNAGRVVDAADRVAGQRDEQAVAVADGHVPLCVSGIADVARLDRIGDGVRLVRRERRMPVVLGEERHLHGSLPDRATAEDVALYACDAAAEVLLVLFKRAGALGRALHAGGGGVRPGGGVALLGGIAVAVADRPDCVRHALHLRVARLVPGHELERAEIDRRAVVDDLRLYDGHWVLAARVLVDADGGVRRRVGARAEFGVVRPAVVVVVAVGVVDVTVRGRRVLALPGVAHLVVVGEYLAEVEVADLAEVV